MTSWWQQQLFSERRFHAIRIDIGLVDGAPVMAGIHVTDPLSGKLLGAEALGSDACRDREVYAIIVEMLAASGLFDN